MSLGHSLRSNLTLTQLEDRCNPASILVDNTQWDPAVVGSLPWAIAKANNQTTNPGQDEIVFQWGGANIGAKPVFNATSTVNVNDGVIIRAGTGGAYATFAGVRPFRFQHTAPAGPTGTGQQSEIIGAVFDGCTPGQGGNLGGALTVFGGQLTVSNCRFTNNTAGYGAAVYVYPSGKLVVDAPAGTTPPEPANYPEQSGRQITLFKTNTANFDGGAIRATAKWC